MLSGRIVMRRREPQREDSNRGGYQAGELLGIERGSLHLIWRELLTIVARRSMAEMDKHKDTKAQRHKVSRHQRLFKPAYFVSLRLCVFVSLCFIRSWSQTCNTIPNDARRTPRHRNR